MADEAVARGEVAVDGGTVRYRVLGSGERALVLLHGGPGAPSTYLRPLEKLAGPDRRVVIYDQLGCGYSDHPEDKGLWRIERYVDELELLRAHLSLDSFDLLGHSWGGMLAIEYALAHQAHLRSLILASTTADAPFLKREMARLLATFPPDLRGTISSHEAAGTTDSDEYERAMQTVYDAHLCRVHPWPVELVETFDRMADDIYGEMWGASEFCFEGNLSGWSRLDRLSEINVPTLVTGGEFDEVTPACARQIEQGIPGARLVVFRNASHVAFHEQPGPYLREIDLFLRSV